MEDTKPDHMLQFLLDSALNSSDDDGTNSDDSCMFYDSDPEYRYIMNSDCDSDDDDLDNAETNTNDNLDNLNQDENAENNKHNKNDDLDDLDPLDNLDQDDAESTDSDDDATQDLSEYSDDEADDDIDGYQLLDQYVEKYASIAYDDDDRIIIKQFLNKWLHPVLNTGVFNISEYVRCTFPPKRFNKLKLRPERNIFAAIVSMILDLLNEDPNVEKYLDLLSKEFVGLSSDT